MSLSREVGRDMNSDYAVRRSERLVRAQFIECNAGDDERDLTTRFHFISFPKGL